MIGSGKLMARFSSETTSVLRKARQNAGVF